MSAKVCSKWLCRLLIASLLAGWIPLSKAGAAGNVLIDDDAHSLSAAGWTRQYAPRAGNYITDEPNSLGNPAHVPMKQVLRGQYLFYSSANGLSNTIKKEVAIGPGSWHIEFEARIADLIAPSDNPAWNGFTVDTVAAGKRYRVTFNGKTGDMDSAFNVLIMKNSASAYDETVVKLDDFADIHKWGIEYDGESGVTVTLDGKKIAKSSGVNVATGYADQVLLYNSSTGLQSGTNEVYLYSYKLVKGEKLRYSDVAVNDNAASFAAAGWTATAPQQGQYITDSANSQGNPESAPLKPVSKGQYLFYGDETAAASVPASMTKSVPIGGGAWTLQVKARIADFMTPSAADADTGFIIQVAAGGKAYKLIVNDRDKLTAVKADNGGRSYSQKQVDLPADDQFHNWSISYDGNGNLFVDLDGMPIAEFAGMGMTTAADDGITLLSAAQHRQSGTTEVYVDTIRLTTDTLPNWAQVKSDAYSAEKAVNVFTDFAERLQDRNWARSADPANGNYISDFAGSLGNPGNIPMLPVPQSQYLFYASSAGTASSIVSGPLSIGAGPWFLELDANIADLITPSANPLSNGFAAEVTADSKTFKVTLNSLDTNGNMKLYVQKDASGNAAETQIALPPDGKLHKWGIGYDGASTLSVILDGRIVTRVPGVNVPEPAADRIALHNSAADLSSGTNEIYVDSMKLDKTNVPDWVFAAIDDNGENLSLNGWTRSNNPAGGNYITDSANSLGNPNQIPMLPVSSGEYLFYSSQNGLYSHIAKDAYIGPGSWYAQVEARIADLPTPSANYAWRGFSIDISANAKRYRLSLNSKDANGNVKIYLLKPGNTYEMKQAALPADGGLHKWGVYFDGVNKLSVDLDGTTVASFAYTDLAATGADGIKLLADTNNLQTGATEVYVNSVRLLRNFKPKLHVPNLAWNTLLDDNASSLKNAGWTSSTPPRTGVYMIDDEPNSLGNPNGVPLKPVPAGQYLAYADGTSASGQYSSMKRNVTIGASAWTLQFDAKIVDLAKATNYYLWKGLAFNIYANNKRYMVALNSYDPAKGTIKAYLITNGTNSFKESEVYLPADQDFHKWEIVYDGDGGLYLGLDDNLIVQANDSGVAAAVGDNVTINNLANDVYTIGTNEVYFDQIKLTQNKIPDWIHYYPNISGVTVKPEASSSSIPLLVNIGGADPGWFADPNVQVRASVLDGGVPVASSAHPLDAPTVSMNVYGGGGSGVRQLVVELLNGGVSVDRAVKEVELFPAVSAVAPESAIVSVSDAVYLFTAVDQMTNGGGQPAAAAGWQTAGYVYKGAEQSVAANVYSLIESTAAAQALTLPVDLTGWFGVYVGYAAGTEQFEVADGSAAKTISMEPVRANGLYSEQTIGEEFVMAADFNGRTLTLAPSPGKKARIAYIKLRGLSPEDVEEYTAPDEGVLGKRAIYNNDGYTHFSSLKYNNVAALRNKAVNLFAGTDVGGIDWALGTTMQLNYDSQYAGMPFDSFTEDDPTLREIDMLAKGTIRNIYDESGKWAPEVLAQAASANGIDLTVSLRMNAFYSMTSFPALNGQLYNDYTGTPYEARQLDANNNPTYRLSYYYSSFRDYIKNILTEAAAIPDVGGVNLDFGRYPYLFGNELTDVASRKSIITQMMSEVRTALPNKTISVRIPYWNYESYGLDPQAWVDQALIDILIPSNISYEDFFDISPFVSMVSGSHVKLYAGIVSDLSGTDMTKEQEAIIRNGGTVENTKRTLSKTQYQKRAFDVYEACADGVYIFNDWWNGKGIVGLLGDKVKVHKWHHFDYYSQLIENPVFIMAP